MIRKYKLPFVCNALTKKDTFRSLRDLLLGRKNKRLSQFQDQWSSFLKVPKEQLFFFGSGRMGVYTFLKSLGLKENDEVLVAGYTCVVLTNAVKFAGCKVAYIDITEETLNLNTTQLLEQMNPATKVVIVPHNFGLVYEDIHLIKQAHPSILIIEDAAHTLGSVDQSGKLCGTIGDAAFFSMEFSKPISTGIGGVLVVNNTDLLPKFADLYAQTPKASRFKAFRIGITLTAFSLSLWKASNFLYLAYFFVLKFTGLLHKTSPMEVAGELPDNYAYKLPASLAVFGYHQMASIHQVNTRKQQLAQRFYDLLKDLKDLHVFYADNYNLVRFPIVFKSHVKPETIERIKQEAKSKGYELGVWFNDVVHPKGSYRYCYSEGTCKVGEHISQVIVNLPININVHLSDAELAEIKAIFTTNGIV